MNLFCLIVIVFSPRSHLYDIAVLKQNVHFFLVKLSQVTASSFDAQDALTSDPAWLVIRGNYFFLTSNVGYLAIRLKNVY